MRERVARSRRLLAGARKVAVVARVMQISRQAIYRTPKTRPAAGRRPATGTVDRAIVEVARANPTDGTRMVAALTSREIERPISRKMAQRVMRAEGLLQRHRPSGRRRRPGCFRVERPERDRRLLHARDPSLGTRSALPPPGGRGGGQGRLCRPPGRARRLILGTDNGTACTSRGFRAHLNDLGVAHRRGGYRDPESQAFIESWFSKLKERLVWRSESETLEEARAALAAYVETCHRRSHSGLGYRTPKEVRRTWEDAQESETSTNSRGLG